MKLMMIMALVALAAVGCGRKEAALRQFDLNAVLKVSVLKSGDVLADGRKVTLGELDSLIATNAQRNGVVWYYRENGKEEPPPQAMQAIKLVVKHKRPISMSSKPDFSDTIDQNGNSVSRK